jgi:hypothetical protein
MHRATFTILGAAIAVVGVGGGILPGLINSGDPVAYLRGAAHGRNGTTTGYDRPGYPREHRWNNESMPVIHEPEQLPPTIPESGGTPREALP